ncbi:MAG TPA: hypothetical protein VI074_11215 [Propionibacteriaceae bacterium]
MATTTALVDRAGAQWTSPALVDGLLAYAVALAVGVAVYFQIAEGRSQCRDHRAASHDH